MHRRTHDALDFPPSEVRPRSIGRLLVPLHRSDPSSRDPHFGWNVRLGLRVPGRHGLDGGVPRAIPRSRSRADSTIPSSSRAGAGTGEASGPASGDPAWRRAGTGRRTLGQRARGGSANPPSLLAPIPEEGRQALRIPLRLLAARSRRGAVQLGTRFPHAPVVSVLRRERVSLSNRFLGPCFPANSGRLVDGRSVLIHRSGWSTVGGRPTTGRLADLALRFEDESQPGEGSRVLGPVYDTKCVRDPRRVVRPNS